MKNFFYFSITAAWYCPACGEFLFGFEALCPECEINLGLYNFNSTGYKGYTVKYFFTNKAH